MFGLARDWKMMSGPRSLEEVFGSRTRILPRKGLGPCSAHFGNMWWG